MNLLIDPLPETVVICGREWAINTAFYTGILFELLMQDQDLTDAEKVEQALVLYYPKIPTDVPVALDRLLWFYRCGQEEVPEDDYVSRRLQERTPKKAYCFEQDAELIFAAFWEAYKIGLNETGMHWWKFRALFRGLPAECEFCKVMGYRTADTRGMGKSQKQFYEKMKKVYALKNDTDVSAALSLAQRNQRMRDYIDRRYREIGGGNHGE